MRQDFPMRMPAVLEVILRKPPFAAEEKGEDFLRLVSSLLWRCLLLTIQLWLGILRRSVFIQSLVKKLSPRCRQVVYYRVVRPHNNVSSSIGEGDLTKYRKVSKARVSMAPCSSLAVNWNAAQCVPLVKDGFEAISGLTLS